MPAVSPRPYPASVDREGRMRTAVAAVAVVGVLAAGCGTSAATGQAGSTPVESPRHLYLRLAHGYADPRVPDRVLLEITHGVCGEFAAGKPWVQLVGELTRGHTMPGRVAGELIATATGVFCPQYKSRLPG